MDNRTHQELVNLNKKYKELMVNKNNFFIKELKYE